ncbi:MAG: hypothetical protein IKH34_01955 [Oscillospiraceae bacterium]|nr:hypothetical protein [Oscillospiraceae bacterium]
METSLRAQALSLLPALLLGMGLGLLYDLLRPPRRRVGRLPAALLDLFFALFAGAAAFLNALASSGGRLGLWELTCTLAGFLFYLWALSPLLLPVLELPFRVISDTIRLFKNLEKKMGKTAKKIFSILKEWIIMRR